MHNILLSSKSLSSLLMTFFKGFRFNYCAYRLSKTHIYSTRCMLSQLCFQVFYLCILMCISAKYFFHQTFVWIHLSPSSPFVWGWCPVSVSRSWTFILPQWASPSCPFPCCIYSHTFLVSVCTYPEALQVNKITKQSVLKFGLSIPH